MGLETTELRDRMRYNKRERKVSLLTDFNTSSLEDTNTRISGSKIDTNNRPL
jgi:hypothetical protein